MRVIAGSARSLRLKTLKGDETRPTTDKIKETLFNILSPDLAGARFLDLFAGSGGIGIEALSRGASEAVFVERSPKAAAVIRENLTHTHLSDRAELLVCDVRKALPELEHEPPFDLIFMDPPYRDGAEKWVLAELAGSTLMKSTTMIIVEAAINTDFFYTEELGYQTIKIKKYGTNKHVFLEPAGRI